MSTKTIISIVIVAILLLVGISFLAKRDDPLPSAHTNTTMPSNNVDVVGGSSLPAAPNFSLQDLNGQTVTLADYKGVKPVVLDFWATWCPNCQRDMPKLNGYYEKYKDQVEVIGVNLQEKKSLVDKFVEQRGITFPIVLDPQKAASRGFGVRYTNYHVLIDINGNVFKTLPGDISESDIKLLIGAN